MADKLVALFARHLEFEKSSSAAGGFERCKAFLL